MKTEYIYLINIRCKKINNYGDWGLGIGDWGLGIGANAQTPNSKTTIPNPHPQPPPKYF